MEQLTPLLERLAAQLGTTTAYLWGVLIQQARVEAITGFSWAVGIPVALYFMRKRYLVWIKDTDLDPFDEPFARAAFWIMFAVLVGIAGYNFNVAIVAAINPEYWALQRILESVK